MRFAAIIPSIILLLLPLLVPTMAASSHPVYCEFADGELAMTAVSSDQEYPEFANGESAVTAVSSDQEYPEFVNGLPVIFVETSENTCWLDPNEVVLVLFADCDSVEGATARIDSIARIDGYLSNYQLPEGWSIDIIGGPGFSKEEFLRIHNANNEAYKKTGPIKLGGPIQLSTSG